MDEVIPSFGYPHFVVRFLPWWDVPLIYQYSIILNSTGSIAVVKLVFLPTHHATYKQRQILDDQATNCKAIIPNNFIKMLLQHLQMAGSYLKPEKLVSLRDEERAVLATSFTRRTVSPLSRCINKLLPCRL